MDLGQLIGDRAMQQLLGDLRRRCEGRQFSDIVDDEGNQYVDLVMEGGGMLGIALVGYTWVLEQMGIRFLGVGGTSAGSINALLLAALDVPAKAKSPKLLQELAAKDFYDFVGGDADARDFVAAFVRGAGKFKLAFKAAQVMDNLDEALGLNPGKAFTDWLTGILRREGIRTLADLRARMDTLPAGLRTRAGEKLDTPQKAGTKLALITADVSTETEVEFPRMAPM